MRRPGSAPPARILAALTLALIARSVAALPAFPGAQGWGAETVGGRGGTIVWVTNLRDSGPGSLRAALTLKEPRTVLFAVSGVIHLQSPIFVGGEPNEDGGPYSYLTVAGQSAPGGGVIVADYTVAFNNAVHDVVVRHLRFRNPRRDLETLRSTGDGIDFKGAERVVVDHCSFSWATDENISLEETEDGNRNITLQNNLVAEGLLHGGHENGEHSRGIQAAKGADSISIHHNFMMSNDFRNPHTPGNGLLEYYGVQFPTFDVRYNMTYNSGRNDAHTKNGARVNYVGNLFIKGPDSRQRKPIQVLDPVVDTRLYLEGNVSPDFPGADQLDLVDLLPGTRIEDVPFDAPAIEPTPTDQLADRMVAGVGARPLDPTDGRLLEEFLSGRGSMGAPDRTHESPTPWPTYGEPEPDADLDGMPDAWELARGLDPYDPLDAWADRDHDGYPNLEERLNERSDELLCTPGKALLVLRSQVVSESDTLEACVTVILGKGTEVTAKGDLTVRAGYRVILENGFQVDAGGQLAIGLGAAP